MGNYHYNRVRPRLWEVCLSDGRPIGRIRHVFSPQETGWIASDGGFYDRANEAASALLEQAKTPA